MKLKYLVIMILSGYKLINVDNCIELIIAENYKK